MGAKHTRNEQARQMELLEGYAAQAAQDTFADT